MNTSPAIFAEAKEYAVMRGKLYEFHGERWIRMHYKARPVATFAQLRAGLRHGVAIIKQGIERDRAYSLRMQIIEESPACKGLIQQLKAMDYLPFGMSASAHKAPIEAQLEAIIAGRMAEMAVAT